jgi:fermentation-respiration switch protein FrsA (DUF1100 family)
MQITGFGAEAHVKSTRSVGLFNHLRGSFYRSRVNDAYYRFMELNPHTSELREKIMFNKIALILAIIGSAVFSLLVIPVEAQKGVSVPGPTEDREIIVTLADFEKEVRENKTVKRTPVTFKNQNLKMAGLIFSPTLMESGKKYPAIVVVHPGGGIKEQTASVYAYRLAQRGYIALAFDASHQGESEGQPRQLEDPTKRVEDVRSAVDYVTTLPYVDKDRIGALGICAGGGYAINASQTERRIKAVATVSAVDFGEGVRRGWRADSPVTERIKVLQAVATQRTAEANGAAPMLVNYVPDTVAGVTEPDMVEASEYYRLPNRWLHKNSGNRFLNSSFDKLVAFSAFGQIDTLLTQPLLMIAGSNAGSRWQSERAVELSKGPKELFIVEGATHMSLYDKDVVKAMPKLTEFFAKNI